MKKNISDVVNDLIILFKIEENKHLGTYKIENEFYISKKQHERFEVLNMLQKYFSTGITITGGYLQVDSITFVHTNFNILEGKPY